MDRRADRLLEKRRWMLGAPRMREAAVRAEARAGWAMTAPALTAIGLFFVVPALAALVLSFTDFDIYALADLANLRFVGLDNYQRLLTNPLFWQAMGNTLWFVVLGVPLSSSLSLGAALLVHARTRQMARGVARRLVRAVRDHARRDRGGVELPAPHPLRADQLRAGARSASRRSTGSAIPRPRCPRSCCSSRGRASATT